MRTGVKRDRAVARCGRPSRTLTKEEAARDLMCKPPIAILVAVLACSGALAQPPARKFDDPGAPPFHMLKQGENPPLEADDNFVVGPNYVPAPERKKVEGVPEGKVEQFEIDSKETRLFNPGIARDAFGKVDPSNPKTLIVETHPIDYKRKVGVYIPAQYKPGTRRRSWLSTTDPARPTAIRRSSTT